VERALIIGMGEVGRRLDTALRSSGVETIPVTRNRGWDLAVTEPATTPRIVCTREEALPSVLERLGDVPSSSLVLVQNGWLRDLLDGRGDITRGLIWFTSKGDFFRPLRPSPFCGPLAGPLTLKLAKGGLPTEAVSASSFAGLDADKMGFNCVVGLPLAVHGVTLEQYLQDHTAEAEAVFSEAVTACAAAADAPVDPEWWPAFLDSAEPLGWVAVGSAKALAYRNGAVLALGRRHEVPTPVNERLLEAVGATS
jgi:hypothetical protein